MTDRFAGASERVHPKLSQDLQGAWDGPFSFVQLADTQFGLLEAMKSWKLWFAQRVGFPVPRDGVPELSRAQSYAKELEFAERAVRSVNAMSPAPAFVVVCGDLVNAFPSEGQLQESQVSDFKRIFSAVHEDIPLVCVCGNHDLGDRPNAATIDLFKRRFGDDYFTFWAGGVKFLVLNSQLYKDAADSAECAAAQDAWLQAELQATKEAKPKHVVCFSHISPFINSADEPSAYFNLDQSVRSRLLGELATAGCTAWFCGHYHRNSGGVYTHSDGRQLEVVTSSAAGATLTTKQDGGDALGLSGMETVTIDEGTSGLRVVTVGEDAVTHEWRSFASLGALQSKH